MTPTEQDKMSNEELKKIINFIINHTLIGTNATLDWRKRDELIKQATELITAGRKRVALEARIDEIENNKWLPNEAKWIEQEADRIAELKAQQEGV